MQLKADAPLRRAADMGPGDFVKARGEWHQVLSIAFDPPGSKAKSWTIEAPGGLTLTMWEIERYQKVDDFELVTKTGRVLTDDDIQRWADEAEEGYNIPPGAVVVDINELRDALAQWVLTGAAKNPDGSPALWTMGEPAAVLKYDEAKKRLAELALRMMGIDPTV